MAKIEDVECIMYLHDALAKRLTLFDQLDLLQAIISAVQDRTQLLKVQMEDSKIFHNKLLNATKFKE